MLSWIFSLVCLHYGNLHIFDITHQILSSSVFRFWCFERATTHSHIFHLIEFCYVFRHQKFTSFCGKQSLVWRKTLSFYALACLIIFELRRQIYILQSLKFICRYFKFSWVIISSQENYAFHHNISSLLAQCS